MNPDSEAVYDEHIAPLMTRLIALCREHRIPLLVNFQLTREGERGDEPALHCTTRLYFEGETPAHEQALNCLQFPPGLLGFTFREG